MNKFAAISLSALMLLNTSPVLAQEQTTENPDGLRDEQTIIIKTADDFIQKFAGNLVVIEKDQKKADEFVWFREADQNNYQIIIQGYEIYQALPEELQKEISEVFEKQKIDYKALVESASQLKKETDSREAKAAAAEKSQSGQDSGKTQAVQNKTGNEKREDPGQQAGDTGQQPGSAGKTAQSADPAAPSVPTAVSDSQKNTTVNQSAPEAVSPVPNGQNEQPAAAENPASDQSPASGQTGSADSAHEPADESSQNADQKEQDLGGVILYEKVIPTASLGDIVMKAQGTPVSDWKMADPQIYEAFISAKRLTQEQLDQSVLYSDVVFSSQSDGLSAASTPMMAIRTGSDLLFFNFMADGESGSALIMIMNPADFSISYSTGAVTLKVQETVSAQITPADSDNTDHPEEADSTEKPDTPAQPDQDSEHSEPTENADPEKSQNQLTAESVIPAQPERIPLSAPAISSKPESPLPVTETENGLQAALAEHEQSAPEQVMPQAQSVSDSVKTLAAAAVNQQAAASVISQSASEPAKKTEISSAMRLNSNTVNSFISNYCSNAQGLIYLKAWSANYLQIMSGYSTWKNLSASDKQAINARLAGAGSVSYTVLYRQAARVSLGLGAGTSTSQTKRPAVNKTPATGTLQHGFTYSFLSVLSGFMACFFLCRSFRKEEKQS